MIVYHEQVMRTLAAVAGWNLTYADHVRRHLDREELLPGFRQDFLRRAAERAHAAAFAVPTYRSAWLKAHYPAHFLAGILTHDPGMYPRRALLDDARRHGIPILPLDVNMSEPEYTAEETPDDDYGIRLGLQDVHGISDAEVRSILMARAERPFTSVEDFLRRTTVARPIVEALAHAGAFDALPRPRPHARATSCGCRSTRGRPTLDPLTSSGTTPTPRSSGRSSRSSDWMPPAISRASTDRCSATSG